MLGFGILEQLEKRAFERELLPIWWWDFKLETATSFLFVRQAPVQMRWEWKETSRPHCGPQFYRSRSSLITSACLFDLSHINQIISFNIFMVQV